MVVQTTLDDLLNGAQNMDTSNFGKRNRDEESEDEASNKTMRDVNSTTGTAEETAPGAATGSPEAPEETEGKPEAKDSSRRVSMSPNAKNPPLAWETVMENARKGGKTAAKVSVPEPDWERKLWVNSKITPPSGLTSN